MAFTASSRGVKSDINVTPLVDVVLVLLIIFMVVSPCSIAAKTCACPGRGPRIRQDVRPL